MAQLVYIDETGSVGKGASKQPYLTLVAVIVPEDKVQPLGEAMHRVAVKYFDWVPAEFEFHGYDIWNRTEWWSEKQYHELIAAYEAVLGLLDELDLSIAHSSINKAQLHARYSGAADANAYRLALQFLLEKIDLLGGPRRIVVADEAKEQQLRAVKMVADMQQWGAGEVPGQRLRTVIDSLHFVQSHASPGVQMADLVAYVLQRSGQASERHPDAIAALARLQGVVDRHTVTWRAPWPQPRSTSAQG